MTAERRPLCTSLESVWCPNHGRCLCPDPENAKDDEDCPLHGPGSDHAQEASAQVGAKP